MSRYIIYINLNICLYIYIFIFIYIEICHIRFNPPSHGAIFASKTWKELSKRDATGIPVVRIPLVHNQDVRRYHTPPP